MEKYQRHIRGTYLANIKRKDKLHFRTEKGARGPLETIFIQIVFGTFGENSSYVRELVEIAVEYGAEYLGRNMAALTIDLVNRLYGVVIRHSCQWRHGRVLTTWSFTGRRMLGRAGRDLVGPKFDGGQGRQGRA